MSGRHTLSDALLSACFGFSSLASGSVFTLPQGSLWDSVRRHITTSFKDHSIIENSNDVEDATVPPLQMVMHESFFHLDRIPLALDVHTTNQVAMAGQSPGEYPFIVSKASGSYESSSLSVVTGDSHLTLGKGIALALYRDPQLGFDNTLLGVTSQIHRDGVESLFFGGQIHPLLAPVALQPQNTPLYGTQIWAFGSSQKVALSENLKVGAHYYWAGIIPFQMTQVNQNNHTLGLVWEHSDLFPAVDWYAESNVVVQNTAGLNQPNAYGTYQSLTWAPVPWSFKEQLKDYRNYNFTFRNPPSLEEDIVPFVDLNNISEMRLTASRRLASMRDTAEVAFVYGQERTEPLYPTTVHHIVGGTQFGTGEHGTVLLRGGYRWVPGDTYLWHARVKGSFRTGPGQNFDFTLEKQKSLFAIQAIPTHYDLNRIVAAYVFSPRWTVSLGFDHVPTNAVNVGTQFFNASVLCNLGQAQAKVFFGRTNGGVLCSGGICRWIPPYSGAMLETTLTF